MIKLITNTEGPKNKPHLKELCRAKEVVCDFLYGENEYKSTGESLDRYFMTYGIAARMQHKIGCR